MRSIAAAVGLCLAAMTLGALASPAAWADYLTGPHMDDSTMDYYYATNLTDAMEAGTNSARLFSVGPTDVTTVLYSEYRSYRDVWAVKASPKCPPYGTATSCEANRATDPFYQHPTAFAVTQCLSMTGGRRDQARVAFNALNTHSNYRSLACHELGHVLGFDDGMNAGYGVNSESADANKSCMRSRPDWTYYSKDHDYAHINGKY